MTGLAHQNSWMPCCFTGEAPTVVSLCDQALADTNTVSLTDEDTSTTLGMGWANASAYASVPLTDEDGSTVLMYLLPPSLACAAGSAALVPVTDEDETTILGYMAA